MDTKQCLDSEARGIILGGNTWAYNFLVFALLIDVMYRALVWHEAAWDLFALLFASGFISLAHAARHKVLILNRNNVMVMSLLALLGAVVAAVVAFTLALTKAM
jgi:hypothetical protein